jgi:hypothetical protein
MLTVFCIVSIFLEVVYILMPRVLKRKIENLDLPPTTPNATSYTTSIALTNLFFLALVIL